MIVHLAGQVPNLKNTLLLLNWFLVHATMINVYPESVDKCCDGPELSASSNGNIYGVTLVVYLHRLV